MEMLANLIRVIQQINRNLGFLIDFHGCIMNSISWQSKSIINPEISIIVLVKCIIQGN